MKITKIETLEVNLSGQDGLPGWQPVFARVHTDEGISGMGEVGLAYGTGAPAAAPMIRALGERFVLGKDPNNTERHGSACRSTRRRWKQPMPAPYLSPVAHGNTNQNGTGSAVSASRQATMSRYERNPASHLGAIFPK
jgi:L-alanine-DL-glutamate epimerase-like enolase superfamily enzyme